MNRLFDWKTSFDHLTYLEAGEDPDEVYGLGSLLTAYFYCHILVHRTAIRIFHGSEQFGDHFRTALTFVDEMLSDFSRLKPANFDSFWFSCKTNAYIDKTHLTLAGSRAHFNSICDFVVLLCCVAPTAAERDKAEKYLGKYRHWLWLRSKSFDLVRMSLVRLDSHVKSALWTS